MLWSLTRIQLARTRQRCFRCYLKYGNLVVVPLNAGWTKINSGSGGSSDHPMCQTLYTGTDAASQALAQIGMYGLTLNQDFDYGFDWSKKLYLVCNYCQSGIIRFGWLGAARGMAGPAPVPLEQG